MIEKENMMEMTNEPKTKKEWAQPELLVMARSNPEEAVLSNCKGNTSIAPGTFDGNCWNDGCSQCFSLGAS